jgi:hypothetical protein
VLQFKSLCSAKGKLSISSDLLFDIDDSHRSLLSIKTPSVSNVAVLTADSRRWVEVEGAGALQSFSGFVVQGIWHIWTGYDHLAFLLLLLLPLIRLREISGQQRVLRMLRIVTAFTVAHSITLGAAAFGYINLPSHWVETAIVASIVITGLANLLPRAAPLGVAMALGFGLIHGLGFASALADLTTNMQGRLLPLVAFNLGVECGQLVVVAFAFPLLVLVARLLSTDQREEGLVNA